MTPNTTLHTNRRPALRLGMRRVHWDWIHCQCPVSAAVGELGR